MLLRCYCYRFCVEQADNIISCNIVSHHHLVSVFKASFCSLHLVFASLPFQSFSVAPTFDLSAFKDGLEVIVPQPLTIRVPISGYPTPAARWAFGDKELTADERVAVTTKSTFTELTVAPSVRPDRGTYSLQLENDMASISGEIEVNVIGETSHGSRFC